MVAEATAVCMDAAARFRKSYPDAAPAVHRAASGVGFTPLRLDLLIGRMEALAEQHAASHIFASCDTLANVLRASQVRGLTPEAVEDMAIRICAAMRSSSHHAFYSLPQVLEQDYLSAEQISRYFELVGKGKGHESYPHPFDNTHQVFASLRQSGFTPEEAMQFFEVVSAGLPADHFFLTAKVISWGNLPARKEGEKFDTLANQALTGIGIGGFRGFHPKVGQQYVETVMDLLDSRGSRASLLEILEQCYAEPLPNYLNREKQRLQEKYRI